LNSTTRWLLFDEIGSGFAGLARAEPGPTAAIRLPPTAETAGTTEWLGYDDVVAEWIQVWDGSGAVTRDAPVKPALPHSTGLPFDRRTGALPPVAGRELVPAFLVAETADGGRPVRHVYCCSRIRDSGMLFSRIWSGTVTAGVALVETVREVCAGQPELLARFSDESVQTIRHDPDIEIEVKFTLLGEVSPWRLACGLAAAVQRRALTGFIPDLGNELQRWSYGQDTFEISGPAGQSGYVAFMADHDDTYSVKYKFFAEDALRRTERIEEDVVLERDRFEEYILDTVKGVEVRALPHLTRTRFDVNVESARTGHFFGLEVDEVHAGGQVLRQLEIEYHKSRACWGSDPATVEAELFRLSGEVQAHLDDWSITSHLGYFSKLSFLKEAAGTTTVDGARSGLSIPGSNPARRTHHAA
jgi:hypothetical protein